jgi:trimeric autotransporter adhesin
LKSVGLALILAAIFLFPGFLRAQYAPAPPQQIPDAPQSSPPPPDQAAPGAPQPTPVATKFEITGTAKAGKTPLPGVTVTATNTLTGKKFSVVTSANGTYTFSGLPRGRYVVRAEFMGFAAQTQEVVLKPETPAGKFDAEMVLASRQQDQGLGNLASLITAGRGFQSLGLDSALSALANGGMGGTGGSGFGGGQNGNGGDLSSLPLQGAGAEGPTESVSITGAQGRSQDFGNENDLEERIQEFRDRAQREGGGLQGGSQGGPGGGGGPGGFGGGPMITRLPRNFNINQPHGMLYVSDDSGAIDAKPYSLSGLPSIKASYNLPRWGAFLGGPLKIPKIFNGGNKWFFFAGWNGNRGSTPIDSFSTVPTAAERNGDFSAATYKDGAPVQIFNPATGQPFQFNGTPNEIDPLLISSAAKSLLAFIPLPNLNTPTQNFHYVTSGSSSTDSVNFRVIHNFGSGGGPMNFGPFGGGGGGGRRRAQNNINFGMNWMRSATTLVNSFPSLAGGNNLQGLNATAGWVYGHGRLTNSFRVNYNHNHVSTTNLYSNSLNVAGDAGITGVSTNPFDFGLPGISFTSFSGLSDPTPRRELDQTYTFSDTVSWSRGRNNWRFGGDYRRILQSFRSAKNAEGSFVFTGFATSQFFGGFANPDTGYDLADFLLGLPQQTSLQSGTSSYNFRANSFDVYAQDDFRFRPNLSFNLGMRYEYNGPYTEAQNQIANLDVGANFVGAAPVLPGSTGQFQGPYPVSLVRPDRNNFAPRLGIAWRPAKQTVVRAGYGINYNLAQYGTFIQNFAFQPPFAVTSTNVSSPVNPLTLENGFPSTTASVTNNFAVDPNYRLGYVQIWNLDVQKQLRGNVVINVGYNGSKGTRLDVQRAISLPGVQPFIYESSTGNSVYNAATIRVRKRMAHGISLSGTYTYSKSIDDASSIGGGSGIVAQDPFDIAADRGSSTFDQRHKFTGNWLYELPFGDSHRFAQRGALSHILAGWQWSGDFTVGSGLYFSPRVLGNSVDISRGVSGSLRANVTGQPIAIGNPTTLQWFNTAAFCSPASSFGSSTPGSSATCVNPNGSSFGDAGRDIIEGPGQVTFDMNLAKIITIKESRALEFRIQAANVFNTAHFTAINTIVNSLTYGEVTSVGAMRRVTLLARFRF